MRTFAYTALAKLLSSFLYWRISGKSGTLLLLLCTTRILVHLITCPVWLSSLLGYLTHILNHSWFSKLSSDLFSSLAPFFTIPLSIVFAVSNHVFHTFSQEEALLTVTALFYGLFRTTSIGTIVEYNPRSGC